MELMRLFYPNHPPATISALLGDRIGVLRKTPKGRTSAAFMAKDHMLRRHDIGDVQQTRSQCPAHKTELNRDG
ncbi:hypothetical protein [Paraburkholderia hospita]|uniref:hypothetical protein n=1 Tax=Paraburkholderia hospita TaxID=169430 RepID=UPI0002718BB5|nr:hypothetical protein [Paraburkholderia hospita]EUC14478.1 hypothetical protein PMI06_006691 [Burkholderia sp. BT03]SKC93737.1 hypothetical protein SAMN06266956_5734 [Paraburkholderia hospita]